MKQSGTAVITATGSVGLYIFPLAVSLAKYSVQHVATLVYYITNEM